MRPLYFGGGLEMEAVDRELLEALKVACPMQMWGIRKRCIYLDTGAQEKFYTREEIVAILVRERNRLKVREVLIQKGLDATLLEYHS